MVSSTLFSLYFHVARLELSFLSARGIHHFLLLRASFSPSPDQVMALSTQIASTEQYIIYIVLGLVVQTFFFGVYTVLIVLSTQMLLKRGLKTRSNKVMFTITVFMYLLSAAYWAYSVADVVDRMRNCINYPQNSFHCSAGPYDAVNKWSPLFNAIVLVNYIISDAVVVWRAWILCLNHRKYLCIMIFFWALTAGTCIFRRGTHISLIQRIQSPLFAPLSSESLLWSSRLQPRTVPI
ncbi:hypothetical protein C8R44DRAFT_693227 [Mycena epipterygia]|nr:hypothetical protein C8R44DRAFT_693227 [Mycena epipterygia]